MRINTNWAATSNSKSPRVGCPQFSVQGGGGWGLPGVLMSPARIGVVSVTSKRALNISFRMSVSPWDYSGWVD